MSETPSSRGHDEHGDHPPHLAHHFDTPEQQFASGKLGMWIFLATEILFFGGLFVAYSVYRATHPEVFEYAHELLDKRLGGINTVVLISSSFTMALAVRFAQLGEKKKLVTALVITLLAAGGFLGIKAIEYEHKWKHGLLWGEHYRSHSTEAGAEAETDSEHEGGSGSDRRGAPAAELSEPGGGSPESESETETESESESESERSTIAPSATGPGGLAKADSHDDAHGETHEEPDNVHIFFGIYFSMTGLHGLHVIIGMGLILWLIIRARRGDFGRGYFTPVDLVGLYWHLVDLIWIFLFPLLYLIK